MTIESEAISHLRALIKDPLGHVAEACLFLARLNHIADAGEMVVDGWQPIETAPKDGSEFLAIGNNFGDPGMGRHYAVVKYDRWGFFSGDEENQTFVENEFLTHWILLPNAPKA